MMNTYNTSKKTTLKKSMIYKLEPDNKKCSWQVQSSKDYLTRPRSQTVSSTSEELNPSTAGVSVMLPSLVSHNKYNTNKERHASLKSANPSETPYPSEALHQETSTEIVLNILNGIISKIMKEPAPKVDCETLKEKNKAVKIKFKTHNLGSLIKHEELPTAIKKDMLFLDTKANLEQLTSTLSDIEIVEDNDDMDSGTIPDIDPVCCHPFEPKWCLGFNVEVPILNLSTLYQSLIMFASDQFAVIYDFHENTMTFLQGHRNVVNCLARNSDASLLATSGQGPDGRVIIWDRRPRVVAVLKHLKGIQLMNLSCCGQYLVTVSPLPAQCVQLWMWHESVNFSSASYIVNGNLGKVKKLTMNQHCAEEFAITLSLGVMFFYLVVDENKCSKSSGKNFLVQSIQVPAKLGTVTDTTFLVGRQPLALSSTSVGYVIVWVEKYGVQKTKFIEKYVRLHCDCITHIQTTDGLIAVATANGTISFFDSSLRILYRTKKFHLGELVSFSFNLNPPNESEEFNCECLSHSSCAVNWREQSQSIQNKNYITREFVVSTTSGKLAYCNTTKHKPNYFLYQSSAIYTALDFIPQRELAHKACEDFFKFADQTVTEVVISSLPSLHNIFSDHILYQKNWYNQPLTKHLRTSSLEKCPSFLEAQIKFVMRISKLTRVAEL